MDFANGEILGGIETLRNHCKRPSPIIFANRFLTLVRRTAAWSIADEVQKDDDDVKVVIEHAPLGVVAGIVPWNFPFQLAIIKIAPALLVGCCLIIKPS